MPDQPTYDLGVLVVSDRRSQGEAPDKAGPALEAGLRTVFPGASVRTRLVPDEVDAIRGALIAWRDAGMALVLTSGGTGLSPRDVTPEATRSVIDRPATGFVVALIASGLEHTPFAMLSRPEAGVAGETLIVNLPGNPDGALESLDALADALPHALEVLRSGPRDHISGHPPA